VSYVVSLFNGNCKKNVSSCFIMNDELDSSSSDSPELSDIKQYNKKIIYIINVTKFWQ